MGLRKTIAISGKPGLFSIINQSKGGFLVQSLVDQKKFPVTQAQNISVLNDIAIYTYDEEKPLREVFLTMHAKEEGKAALNHKDSNDKLQSYFSEILPDYDQERVYTSNIKKVIQWYNILVAAKFDFTTLEEKEDKKVETVK